MGAARGEEGIVRNVGVNVDVDVDVNGVDRNILLLLPRYEVPVTKYKVVSTRLWGRDGCSIYSVHCVSRLAVRDAGWQATPG